MAKKDTRFKVIHTDSAFLATTQILVDTETGANYLWHTEGNAGGLTVLLNADGTPVVTPKSQLMDD